MELGRSLDWQICRARTTQDAIREAGRASEHGIEVGSRGRLHPRRNRGQGGPRGTTRQTAALFRAMPRFYFDAVVNGRTAYDDVGVEVASLELARLRALRTAGEVTREATARGELADIAVNVRVGGVEPIAVARISMEMK